MTKEPESHVKTSLLSGDRVIHLSKDLFLHLAFVLMSIRIHIFLLVLQSTNAI